MASAIDKPERQARQRPRPRRLIEPKADYFASLRPSAIYAYGHGHRLLLPNPLTAAERDHLEQNCTYLRTFEHGEPVYNNAGEFIWQVNIWPYRQRLQISSPNAVAQAALAELPKRDSYAPLLNYFEPAIEWVLGEESEAHLMLAGLKQCFAQLHNGGQTGKHMPVAFDSGGFSAGRRSPGKYATGYVPPKDDGASYVTGEIGCCRLEFHVETAAAIRAFGIQTVSDLAEFDYLEFWRKYLRLYDIDPRRLGRTMRNRNEGTRRRAEEPDDMRFGQIICRAYGASEPDGSFFLQPVLDRVGVGPFLTPIPVDHLLPSTSRNALFT